MGRIDVKLSFPEAVVPAGFHEIEQTGAHRKDPINLPKDSSLSTSDPVSQSFAEIDSVSTVEEYPIRPRYVADKDLPHIPACEVCKRDGKVGTRLWIVVEDIVFDCTEFKLRHPGGKSIIESFGGHDCSWQWFSFHSQDVLNKSGKVLRVGRTSNVSNKYEKPERKYFKLKTIGEQW